MKQINLLLVSLLLVVGSVFTSCTKEDDGSSTLDFLGGTYIDQNTTVEPGASLNFKFNATSNSSMEYADVEIETSASISQVKWFEEIPNESKNNYTATVALTAPTEAGAYTYHFTIYDANALTDENANVLVTKTLVITVAASTPLTNVQTGKIYHIQAATGNGAWDLVANVAKYAADAAASKDMIQASTNTSGSAWVAGWNVGAGNSTMFVKANTYDYTNATFESAKSTYTAGTASAQIRDVVANDIYIAKLRGQDDYAVIKITKMDPLDATGTSGSNKGIIEFSYKKKP